MRELQWARELESELLAHAAQPAEHTLHFGSPEDNRAAHQRAAEERVAARLAADALRRPRREPRASPRLRRRSAAGV